MSFKTTPGSNEALTVQHDSSRYSCTGDDPVQSLSRWKPSLEWWKLLSFNAGETKRQRLSGSRDSLNLDTATTALRKDSESRFRPIRQSESILERLVRESDSVQCRTKQMSVRGDVDPRKLLNSQLKPYGWFVPLDSWLIFVSYPLRRILEKFM